jgi:hypothetical protein
VPRFTAEDFAKVVSRPGYGVSGGIKSTLGKGVGGVIKREKLLNEAGGEGEVSILERSARPKSVRPKDLTIPHSGRVFVRIKVFRQRLTDTGNDCWKYHLDACRYLGLLADDNDATIHLAEEPHERVKTKEEERVEITLEYDGLSTEDVVRYYESGPKNSQQ